MRNSICFEKLNDVDFLLADYVVLSGKTLFLIFGCFAGCQHVKGKVFYRIQIKDAKIPKICSFDKGRNLSFCNSPLLSTTLNVATTNPFPILEKPDLMGALGFGTEDGFELSCVQWAKASEKEKEKSGCTVLLLNGYSTESFWLPTEEHDLVRALLQQGHEVWLLKSRLHPDHATTHPFNLDHLAIFDLPAAFLKIEEVHGSDMDKVHVVAHCVGGLAIHMAILGGFVPASSIASLTCTNSGMFFRVSPLARIKLWLPLIPISMALIGDNPLLQLTTKNNHVKDGWRHALLKNVARAIPRSERCMCNECEVFSGVFGNTFWHDNVRSEMHEWLNKENVHHLPMQAFTHLREICNAGTLVSANGQNMYLPFVDRLAVPTTYISGGRPILVLPTTSEHSHAFMQLHHPHLPHKRLVIPGYGHSDLLIGEFAHRDVFPHILSSISRSETKQQPSLNLQAHTTITWNEHTFEPNSMFYSYLSFSTFSLIILLVYFLVCVQLI